MKCTEPKFLTYYLLSFCVLGRANCCGTASPRGERRRGARRAAAAGARTTSVPSAWPPTSGRECSCSRRRCPAVRSSSCSASRPTATLSYRRARSGGRGAGGGGTIRTMEHLKRERKEVFHLMNRAGVHCFLPLCDFVIFKFFATPHRFY